MEERRLAPFYLVKVRLRVYTGAEIVDRAHFSDARRVHHARLRVYCALRLSLPL